MRPADRRQLATVDYLRQRRRRRLVLTAGLAIFVASVLLAHIGAVDIWSRFNHRRFRVVGVVGGDAVVIETGPNRTETVQLLGIVAPTDGDEARAMLSEIATGREATLLLPGLPTRDEHGRLLASVFVDGENVSVALAKAGVVYADRRQTNIMSGLIDPAEAEARRKKRGLWEDIKLAQMPSWRQAWLGRFQKQSRISN